MPSALRGQRTVCLFQVAVHEGTGDFSAQVVVASRQLACVQGLPGAHAAAPDTDRTGIRAVDSSLTFWTPTVASQLVLLPRSGALGATDR